MQILPPKIIQGGMGVGISDWRLAQAVSKIGQLGVVSGTGLDGVLARRLQNGDPGELVRRALDHFPLPAMAQRVLDRFFVPEGKDANAPYKLHPMQGFEGKREPLELCIVGNFVEVFLAKQGHSNPVGINYLEKIQLPHLASMYGALLAGVAVVIMGAGIPLAVPGIIHSLLNHEATSYPIQVVDENGKYSTEDFPFDPQQFMEAGVELPVLARPDFFPIVSSEALATILLKRASGPVDGFIVEANQAGGHNAPPRGKVSYNDAGEPIYGKRDAGKLSAFREMGVPFWLAGARGSAAGYQQALEEGAAGIQVGTAFALCEESGMLPEYRRKLVSSALKGQARVFTDPLASPTGFPFKVADLAESLSDKTVYEGRKRICDLGMLRQPYRKADGSVGFRCPAEPEAVYVAKGGQLADTVGRKCLCNALSANVGFPQVLADGSEELALITMGDDLSQVQQFCAGESVDFSAEDVVNTLLG